MSDSEIKEIIQNLFDDLDAKIYNKKETVLLISSSDYNAIKAKWLK